MDNVSPFMWPARKGKTKATERASQVAQAVKNLPANAEDLRDVGSIPGSGRFPRGGHGNPLQYSRLENPMDRGTWRATIHRVTKSWTWVKWLSMHSLKATENKTVTRVRWYRGGGGMGLQWDSLWVWAVIEVFRICSDDEKNLKLIY